jgi:putative ABC transport system permease protein
MNIMLVVVGERRREIGLRKAVGATNRAIFIQFLIEAASVAIGAGVVGAIVGLAVVQLLASRLPPDDPTAVPPLFEPLTAGVVAMALSMTAVAAGLLPAIRASQIAPADALRDL